MDPVVSLYRQHLIQLQLRVRKILEHTQLDALLIHSGEPLSVFLDDRYYTFQTNPHFKAWLPITKVPHCWLLVDGVNRPKVWFYSPVDYWHSVEPLPDEFWTAEVELCPLKNAGEFSMKLATAQRRVAYIGDTPQRAIELGIQPQYINPPTVLNFLHYHRSYKTEYELFCMRQAQSIAVAGHHAARNAFFAGASEFEINTAYLQATGQRDTEVPYDNIVALNEHAAVLHYTKLDRKIPEKHHSFLLDAGAEYAGYAADITRTYAFQQHTPFASLVAAVNQQQQALISTLKKGVSFVEYHEQMNKRLAGLLLQHQLLQQIGLEEIIARGLVAPFFPHGLGHPLGLQVHDVAGFMQDEAGTVLAAPYNAPYLRCTRILQPGMVLTIEPGLYFIDSLLASWREAKESRYFNWPLINELRIYGGIRIEDNIVVHEDRVENMTRDCLLE